VAHPDYNNLKSNYPSTIDQTHRLVFVRIRAPTPCRASIHALVPGVEWFVIFAEYPLLPPAQALSRWKYAGTILSVANRSASLLCGWLARFSNRPRGFSDTSFQAISLASPSFPVRFSTASFHVIALPTSDIHRATRTRSSEMCRSHRPTDTFPGQDWQRNRSVTTIARSGPTTI